MQARQRRLFGLALAAILVSCGFVVAAWNPLPLNAWLHHPLASFDLARGENPYPVKLVRPPSAPLSAMAELGRQIYFDASLSSSGKLSCASCHDPEQAYGPPSDEPAVLGGPDLSRQGARAVPSLMYLERQPNFSVGPDDDENESASLAQLISASMGAARARKTAQATAAAAANLVPQGGLFWDGRADTLQDQALSPLLNPLEMDAGSVAEVTSELQRAPYASLFVPLFGPAIFQSPDVTVAEALFAVARYQIEAPGFHPYSSKYDYWLEGEARLSPAELRGYLLFNDPDKANCGGCHLAQPSGEGLPPLFTDHQFEALGVPRNSVLVANHDPAYADLGLCGPFREDLRDQTQYCGLFITPTLRNVARRRVFFHNGVYRSLQEVMDFYDFRDSEPERIYPRTADGKVEKFNDLPVQYRTNIDVTDPPFDRALGAKPPMSPADERDIIAFLKTLSDGYQPATRP